MRVVLDTNVYVSALVFGGPPREILQRAERGEYELAVSSNIREEVIRVLVDKFDWPLKRVEQATEPIWDISHFVTPKATLTVARDPTDNRILECAVEGNVEVIVSRDKDLLSLNPFEGIFILKVPEFLAALKSTK